MFNSRIKYRYVRIFPEIHSLRHLHNTPLCYLDNININSIELLDMLNGISLDTLIKM